MEKEKFLMYEAPVVEVIEVEVEKGFATSSIYSTSSTTINGLDDGGATW